MMRIMKKKVYKKILRKIYQEDLDKLRTTIPFINDCKEYFFFIINVFKLFIFFEFIFIP